MTEIKIKSLLNSQAKGSRITKVGEIKNLAGNVWTFPSASNFNSESKAIDLYNENSDTIPSSMSDVEMNSVPITKIDEDGKVIAGYIFADKYFELHIRGKLIDVGFTFLLETSFETFTLWLNDNPML